MRTRRELIRNAVGLTMAAIAAAQTPSGRARGWSIHIVRVRDLLKLRAGGPLGPVLHWRERGDEQYTWKDTDPDEERSLGRWFKPETESIQLTAELDKNEPPKGERACHVTIMYKGKPVEEWKFGEKESAKVFRRA